ncbi:Z1 domain-containing protein [Acetobacterium wieringae]|uniref:Z1 domain-containing protein n=1 Tax=Acetobacterium wieringae TaxID=52694 RepID=UPI0020337715|nr:Z1 domain-containing protein [Acetobacterium wieringae]URN83917.1 Z1 domain-containing protein [Acetobacterium wieringae]
MIYLEEYLNRVRTANIDLALAIKDTTDAVSSNTLKKFNYREHSVSLLVGNVQSGKTSHMFGVISAAADEGFGIFLLLTTDNVLLQQQTFERAKAELLNFCICDEDDYIKFSNNNLRKPTLIVLKKNGNVLKKWKNNFASTQFCIGNPLFIMDDEADAASLNTLVNKKRQSTINKNLDEIKRTTSCSIYMQVTATPQSILLQTTISGWKPQYIYYFKPGRNYIGGDFFFREKNDHLIITDNDEADNFLEDDENPENGLKNALIMHLISSADILLKGGDVCNFLVHPSMKTDLHVKFAEKIGDYLNELSININNPLAIESLKNNYNHLKQTKNDLSDFKEIHRLVKEKLETDKVNILLINSKSSYKENTQYSEGINIIIGGNSLGRGITFPKLQTIYYCRVAKNPQADTMWQHSRMFGYDRDQGLVRVFMPKMIAKLFANINETNNILIAQIEKYHSLESVKMYYPIGLKPTRANVISKKSVALISGGVNYFPIAPSNISIFELDSMLEPFNDEYNSINLNMMIKILEQTVSENDDWSNTAFISFIKAYIAENPLAQGIIMVRRDRNISKDTGTLLSPNDRQLGKQFNDQIVLTLYKVTGKKGWDGKKLWIPNIKFPDGMVYYQLNDVG